MAPAYSADFGFGKLLVAVACLFIAAPIALLIHHCYRKHEKWRTEHPSKYIFFYSHSVDIFVWIAILYWFYVMWILTDYYVEYCENELEGNGQTETAYCSTIEQTTDSGGRTGKTYQRIERNIYNLWVGFLALFTFLCVQQVIFAFSFCICDEKSASVEFTTTRTSIFNLYRVCKDKFYDEYYEKRYYFYQLICHLCIQKECPSRSVIIIVGIGSQCVFFAFLAFVGFMINQIEGGVFQNQGIKYYEYVPIVIIVIQQIIVQFCYMFPCDGEYNREKEWTRAIFYLLHKQCPHEIAHIIIDCLPIMYDQEFQETDDYTILMNKYTRNSNFEE